MKIDIEFLKTRPISYSSLKEFGRTPLHYISYLEQPRIETPALLIGKAVHCLVLQPELYLTDYAIQPEADGRTKEGKEIKTKFAIEAAGKTILTKDQSDLVLAMAQSVERNDAAMDLIDGCTGFEQRINFNYKGLPFVSVIDGMNTNYILELKTTENASNDAFSRDAYNYKYCLQAAIYCEATGLESVKYIVIEKSLPNAINIFQADEEFLESGKKLLDRLCDEFISCMENNKFGEGYEYWRLSEIESLSLPAWALKSMQL